MLQNFLLAIFSAAISFFAWGATLEDDGRHSSRLHWFFRLLVYPFYLFAFAYFFCLFFALTVWIPNLIDEILKFIVAMILLWMDTPDWVGYILLVVADLALTPILFFVFHVLVTIWDFGEDKYFTFFYRLFILIPMTIFMVYVIWFRPMDGLSWWDNAIYAGAIIVSAIYTYISMKEDLHK